MGYHPYHFWGLADSNATGAAIVPVTSDCNTVIFEHNYQNADALGREAVREAIEIAENRLREYLHYDVAPKYRDELVQWPRFLDKQAARSASVGADGRWLSATLPDGYVQAVGTELLTLVGAATLAWSDTDGDTLKETWTLTVATTATDPAQIAVYFQAADRLDSAAAGERWRILPVAVSIAGGVATVIGKAWQVVKPIKYEGFATAALDPTIIPPTAGSPFAAALDVYTRTTFTAGTGVDTAQAKLIWETAPAHGWWCWCASCSPTFSPTSSAYDPAAIAVAVARVGIRNARLGIVTPAEAVMDATTGIWAEVPWDVFHEPDRVQVRYLAGYPLDAGGNVDKRWEAVVARLAAAEMPNRLAACDTANRELYRWQFDAARAGGRAEEQYKISDSDLDNPFGTRFGQIYAWRQVRNLRTMPSVLFP